MSRKYMFVDEAGNLDFSLKGSRYFILTSVALDDCAIGQELLELRRELVWNGADFNDAFHATSDKQAVRDEVFKIIARHDLRIDATIFEKAKTSPRLQGKASFYEVAWYLHMRHIAPLVGRGYEELFVVGASIGTRKKQAALTNAIRGVMTKVWRDGDVRTVCWPAGTDPCLQVADYCCWAIQRKWEGGDERSHLLVKHMIRTEFDIFKLGKVRYY